MQDKYKIGEVASRLNLKTYVLRFWETEFPQIVPLRSEKGQRLYTAEHIGLLRRIRHLLHERGLTIDGARKVLADETIRGVCYSEDGSYTATKNWFTEVNFNNIPPDSALIVLENVIANGTQTNVQRFGAEADEFSFFTGADHMESLGQVFENESADELVDAADLPIAGEQQKASNEFVAVHLTLPGCPAPNQQAPCSEDIAQPAQNVLSPTNGETQFDRKDKTHYFQTEVLKTVIHDLEAVKKILGLPPNEIPK